VKCVFELTAAGPGCPSSAGSAAAAPAPVAKRIQHDWKLVLGEAALDIKTGRVSSTSGVGKMRKDQTS
jgi:hypothetical protein